MKQQYVGDINDYQKYALLRVLADGGRNRIGVCWMLTPPDGRPDGNKTEYLDRPEKWRHLDPELFDLLKSVIDSPDDTRLGLIEASGAIPGAVYANDILPDPADQREAYFRRVLEQLSIVDLVFFDPDNGLEVPSKPRGRRDSSKFLYEDEVAATYAGGHSLLIYQHFPREDRDRFIERKTGDLERLAPGARVWGIRTANVVFFLVVQPAHAKRIQPLLVSITQQLGQCLSVDPM